MFSLTIENKDGQRLDLTSEKDCEIIGIEGLTPPAAEIVMTQLALADGTRFNSATVGQRNLVLHIRLLRDVENFRILLYKYFRVRQYCKIYYKNGVRDVYCEGYVETFENDRFTLENQVDISIICPSPWFKEVGEIYFLMSQILPMFEFPFSIAEEGIEFSVLDENLLTTVTNSGDVETGVVMQLMATGEVINPRIYNADTHDMIGVNITMENGDLIEISTMPGSKYVHLVRDGVTSNIINSLMGDPVWFTIPVGNTNFTFDCASGNEFLSVQFIGQNLFEGV